MNPDAFEQAYIHRYEQTHASPFITPPGADDLGEQFLRMGETIFGPEFGGQWTKDTRTRAEKRADEAEERRARKRRR